MTHTPAPWKANGTRINAGKFEIQIGTTVGAPAEEWNANAALIAAAPELLEALMTIASNASSVQLDPQWAVQVAKAAIARVTGGSDV